MGEAHVHAAQPPRRRVLRALLLVGALAMGALAWACSPVYVIKAGIAEAKILRARRPIPEVVADPATDADTRGKLAWVLEARAFAVERMGIDAGDAYTMYTRLDRDTLALVLSAAERDRLAPKTWWFPIVGRVPYKGFFDTDDALSAQAGLEGEGFDTYLRPTAAFSTLGWFNDPILSTVLRADEVDVVETVLHELSHNFLFVPGQVGFNESFAMWAGRVGAVEFFCTRPGSGPESVKCLRAQARWRDEQRFSAFLDGLVDELRTLYGSEASREDKLRRREEIFARALALFDAEVVPTFEESAYGWFRRTPLNNATLLGRIFYYHRLPDFQAHLDRHGGDLKAALAALRAGADSVDDPFVLLPSGSPVP
ncbi:MAG: aminopeptidase [Longimicrobiales bacterium]